MKLFKIFLIMVTCLSLLGCEAKKEKSAKKNKILICTVSL